MHSYTAMSISAASSTIGVVCSDGDLRLVGGVSSSEAGRLEICINNAWGTICQEGFSSDDAEVACRQLLGESIQINGTSYLPNGHPLNKINFANIISITSFMYEEMQFTFYF